MAALTMRRSDTLIVTLMGPDGACYTWEQSAGNPSVLTPTGPVTVQPGEGLDAPALSMWVYQTGPGKTTLSWVWRRPSEGDAPTAKQCDIAATVR